MKNNKDKIFFSATELSVISEQFLKIKMKLYIDSGKDYFPNFHNRIETIKKEYPYDPYWIPHHHINPNYVESSKVNDDLKIKDKYIYIYLNNVYDFTYYNRDTNMVENTIGKVLNIICNQNDPIMGYLEVRIVELSDKRPIPVSPYNICNEKYYIGQTINIPIGNIHNIDVYHEKKEKGGTAYMILGISATMIKSIVVHLDLINDNPNEAIKQVDMEVGTPYKVYYTKPRRHTIYEISGILESITEIKIPDYKEDGHIRFKDDIINPNKPQYPHKPGLLPPNVPLTQEQLKKIPDYDKEYVGMQDTVYEKEVETFFKLDKDMKTDVEFMFNIGDEESGNQYEIVYLSQIRDVDNLTTDEDDILIPPYIHHPGHRPPHLPHPSISDEATYSIDSETLSIEVSGNNINNIYISNNHYSNWGDFINNESTRLVSSLKNYATIMVEEKGKYTLGIEYRDDITDLFTLEV